MFKIDSPGRSRRSGRRTARFGALAALAFFTLLNCGQGSSPLAPESAGIEQGPAASASTSSPFVTQPDPVSLALVGNLPIVSEPWGFSTDGVIQFLKLPDLSLKRGSGKWISAAKGGYVELNGFRVDIPAGALAQDTFVSINLPTTPGLAIYDVAQFGPTGTRFRKPVKVTFPLTGTNLLQFLLPSVNVGYWNGTTWESYGGTRTTTSISTWTDHFSTYGACGQKTGVDAMSGG